jgi:long-chain acyl-CoA synthetase
MGTERTADEYARGTRMTQENVWAFLSSAHVPDVVALEFERDTYTYADLDRESTQVATYALQLGLSKGDRVLLLGENSFFWVVSYLGILRAGLVCVPLAPSVNSQVLRQVVDSTEPRLACIEARAYARYAQALGNRHVLTDAAVAPASSVTLEAIRGAALTPPRSFPSIARDDLAALMFTSGSTGVPRGVMVSHGNIIANTTSIVESLALTSQDRIMVVLPFHYCFGTSLLHTHLRVGGTLVVDSRFMYVETILERMVEARCTGFAGVPSHFQILLRNSSLQRRRFPDLRYVQQAGGYLAPALIDELREALPGTRVFIMYGQTEATARLSCLSPDFIEAKRGSIGKGIPGVSLRVLSESGADVQPGEVGEIVAEGANISKGYWRAADESRTTFRQGRLYTGDLATVDDDGFIYVVGRAKEFLKVRGERIGCHALEAQLLECDELLEAAVIGTADNVLGEAVKAFVVPRASTPDGLVTRLQAFCESRMPSHFVPREIVVMASLPKNAAGKIIRRELTRLSVSVARQSRTS